MSDAAAGGSMAKVAPSNPLVESILSLQFPLKSYLESMQAAFAATNPRAELPELQKIAQRRAELLALSDDELQRLYAELTAQQKRQAEAREAALEAARFYNQPQAQPNFAFWLNADFWTFDDALALLLGKNPKVVTWDAVNDAINPKGFFKAAPARSKFLTAYTNLRDLALRSEVMTSGPRLKPVEVATWARQRVGLQLPEPLLALLQRTDEHTQPRSAPPAAATAQATTEADTLRERTVHSTRALRRDALTPAIEEAQTTCRTDPYDVAAVWATLLVMAEKKIPPLIGATEDGLQYLDQGQAATLTRRALAKRLARAKERG